MPDYPKLTIQDQVDQIRREIEDRDSADYRWSNAEVVKTLSNLGLNIAMEYLCLEGYIDLTTPALSGSDKNIADFQTSLTDKYLKMQHAPWYLDANGNWYEIDTEIINKRGMLNQILGSGQTGLKPTDFYISDDRATLWYYPAAPAGRTIRVFCNIKPEVITTTDMSTSYSQLPAVFHRLQWLRAAYTIACHDRQLDKQAPSIGERYTVEKGLVDSFWSAKVDRARMIQPYHV